MSGRCQFTFDDLRVDRLRTDDAGPILQSGAILWQHVIVEEILNWQPQECITRRMQIFDTGLNLVMTHLFRDRADGGTHIEVRVGKPAAEDMERFMQVAPIMQQSFQASGETLVKMLNEEAARSRAAQSGEPNPPVSRGRFTTEPLTTR